MAAFLGPLLVAVSSPLQAARGEALQAPLTVSLVMCGRKKKKPQPPIRPPPATTTTTKKPSPKPSPSPSPATRTPEVARPLPPPTGPTATTPSKASTGDASIERDAERLKVSRERYGRPITVVYVMGKIDHFNFWYQVAKEKDYAVLTQRYLCKQSATSKRHKEQHLTTKAVDAAIMKMVKLGYSRILFVGYPCDEASSRAALEANASFAYSAAVYYTVHDDQKRPRLLKHLLCNHKKTLVHYDFIKRGDWDGETLHMLKANPLNDHFEEAGRVRHYLLALFEELIEKANLDAEPEGPASTGTYIYCDLDQDNDEEYAGSRFEGTQRDEVAVEKDVLPKTTETVDSDRTKNTANSLKTQRTQLSAIQPSLQASIQTRRRRGFAGNPGGLGTRAGDRPRDASEGLEAVPEEDREDGSTKEAAEVGDLEGGLELVGRGSRRPKQADDHGSDDRGRDHGGHDDDRRQSASPQVDAQRLFLFLPVPKQSTYA